MLSKLFIFSLLIVGLIKFLPIVGVLGVKNLEAAYQVKIASADLALLMQHRARLFGLLGGFVLYSCIYAQYQPAAMLMAVISMIGYAILIIASGTDKHAILRVLYVDYVGMFFLSIAVIIKYGFIRG